MSKKETGLGWSLFYALGEEGEGRERGDYRGVRVGRGCRGLLIISELGAKYKPRAFTMPVSMTEQEGGIWL